jgi:hypothetical protein
VRPRPPGSRGPSVFSILPQLSLARETRPDEERRFRRDAVRPVVPFGRVVPKACPPALTHFRAPERPHRIAGAGLAGGRQGGSSPARPVPAERVARGSVAAVAVDHAGAAPGLLVARHAPPVPPERRGERPSGRARLAHVALARAPPPRPPPPRAPPRRRPGSPRRRAASRGARRNSRPPSSPPRRRRRRATPSPRFPASTSAPRLTRGPRPRARRSCSSRRVCSAARGRRWTSSSSAPWRARCASSPASSRLC